MQVGLVGRQGGKEGERREIWGGCKESGSSERSHSSIFGALKLSLDMDVLGAWKSVVGVAVHYTSKGQTWILAAG